MKIFIPIGTFLFFLTAFLPVFSVAQPKISGSNSNSNRVLSSTDSLRLKGYISSAFSSRLGSSRRQLYLDSALQISPTEAYFWQQKAMPLYKAKKYEVGMSFLDSAVKYNAFEYLDYRGFMKCIFQKSYHQALQDFNKATTLKGNGQVMDHSYVFYKGLCYLQLTQYDSAQHLFEKVVSEKRKVYGDAWLHPTELFYLAIAFYEKEEYTRAIQYLDEALKLYKEFSDAEYYKSLCLKDSGKFEEALKVMEAADIHFKQGYSINEDNVFYEDFPYQIKRYHIETVLERLRSVTTQLHK